MKVELPGENIPARGTLVAMTTRTNSKVQHPFELKRVDRALPPGEYRVVTGELLISPWLHLVVNDRRILNDRVDWRDSAAETSGRCWATAR